MFKRKKELPVVLFDSYKVYQMLSASDKSRIKPEHVAIILDAAVRAIREEHDDDTKGIGA
jgi:hypothetical protein